MEKGKCERLEEILNLKKGLEDNSTTLAKAATTGQVLEPALANVTLDLASDIRSKLANLILAYRRDFGENPYKILSK